MPFLSKYGVARHIYIAIPKAGSANHAVSADWTPAAGDVKISKDGGAAANVTNLPTAIAMGNSTIWDFSLTATEMQAAQVMVTVADTATKAVDDTGFIIETYGNASGQHAVDLDDGVRAGLTALPNAAADAAGGLPISDAGGLDLDALNTNVSSVLTDTGTTLDNHLTDIKGTGFVKDTHSLTNIEGYADLIDDGTSGLAKIATDVAAILADTGTDGVVVAAGSKTGYALSATGSAAMTEDYAADGAAGTLNQLLYMILQSLHEFAISGTTRTVKKLDGSTTAMTFTLDDATNPSSTTRAT